MIEAIKAGYDSIKGALDIAQGFQALKTEAAVNQAVINIQRSLLEAQRALNEADARHTADLARVSELEQQVMKLKDWSAERERYHLVDVWRGALAYMPKPGMEDGKPAHWLCVNCFEQGRKSPLQFKGQDQTKTGGLGPESSYGCDACRASIKVSFRTKPAYPVEGDGKASG